MKVGWQQRRSPSHSLLSQKDISALFSQKVVKLFIALSLNRSVFKIITRLQSSEIIIHVTFLVFLNLKNINVSCTLLETFFLFSESSSCVSTNIFTL